MRADCAPRQALDAPVSWAAATWSVPAAIVTWLLVTLLIGLAINDVSENAFFILAGVIAAVMAGSGAAISRRGSPAIRGIGTGLMYAGSFGALVMVAGLVR